MLGFFATLFGCGNKQPSVADITKQTIPVEHITPTSDQLTRRLQSEKYCTQFGVPIYKNPNALFVNAEKDVTLRTQDAVVDRALALFYVGLKGEKMEQAHLDAVDRKYHISSKLSEQEGAFAKAKQPTEQQYVDASWRYESLHVMLWALGFIDSLSYPTAMCDVAKDVTIINNLTEAQFKQQAKLRSKQAILDQADLILRLNWACVSARVKGLPAPSNMDKGIVLERHQSLNWLINYLEQDWDNVSTDT
jgi:hypothetical protein